MKTVDEYIAGFPADIQNILQQVRSTIKEAAPDAVESMAYGMPAYKFKGKPVAYFGAFAKHIGFYATPNAHATFTQDLAKYKQGKGSVQFPLSQPITMKLIARMVSHNVSSVAK